MTASPIDWIIYLGPIKFAVIWYSAASLIGLLMWRGDTILKKVNNTLVKLRKLWSNAVQYAYYGSRQPGN